MTATAQSNNYRIGAATATPKAAPKKIKKLGDITPYLKIMLFGESGTGKSYIIAQLIEAGYKVLVLDSDVGGDGLNTVRSYLKENKKLDLINNCMVLPINSFDEAKDFISNPEKTFNSWVDGETWANFNPDWIVWDGYGNFQQVYIWDYALEFDGGTKATEQRQDGVALETKDWQTVLKATHFTINDFGRITGPNGKPIHKIWSTHLDNREIDPTGKKVNQGDVQQRERLTAGKKPLLSGRGSAMVVGAGDYAIRTFTKQKPGGKVSYCWDMTPAEEMNKGKVRGKALQGGPVIDDVVPIDRIREMIANIDISGGS